ncbi:hypothetical protein ABEB36_006927 [Hypothenemus hampei]|uniref:Uncharacterized protein n=1 Tax=Hypothenemus hampei TaxID=57062 RepID=A0ABD1ES88_HYPHA
MCHCHQIEPANCVQQALLSNRKKMPETVQDLVIRVTDELILTPFASASLVNEILKGLLYQKSQIPYPYSWLKEAIEKRRKKLSESDANVSKKLNFTHENHYRTVSKACDFLEVLMKGIAKEFSENIIKEIVVMLGTSPNCPKEVVTIQIPHIDQEHIERNHISELNKHLQKVLRHIFLSQTWMDSVNTSLTCTNTYVYLKKLANEIKEIAVEI